MKTNEKFADYLETCEKLWMRANSGEKFAQWLLVNSIACGKNGFDNNIDEIMRLAELGWKEAQSKVYYGYKFGWHGFPQDLDKALVYENKWSKSFEESNKE